MNDNKKDWNEKSIEKLLMDLPAIHDKQSKEDIYNKVQLRIQEQQRKKPVRRQRWLIPSVATAAVIVIFVALLPSLFSDKEMNLSFHQQNDSSSLSSENSQLGDQSVAEVETFDESNSNMMMSTPEEESTESIKRGYLGAVQELPEGSDAITIALPNSEAQFTVPMSFVVSKSEGSTLEPINELVETINTEKWGLLPSPLTNLTFTESQYNETEKQVVIDVQHPGWESLSSAEAIMLKQSIVETFSSMGYQYVELTTEGEPGVIIGPLAEEEELPLQKINRGYYMYESGTGHQLLVRGSAVSAPMENPNGELLTLMETIEQMKNGNEEMGYKATIPNEVIIIDAHEQGQLLTIEFEAGTVLENNDISRVMIEALLFTAKDFGFSQVQFEGLENQRVGAYDLNEVIEVPIAVNAASVQE